MSPAQESAVQPPSTPIEAQHAYKLGDAAQLESVESVAEVLPGQDVDLETVAVVVPDPGETTEGGKLKMIVSLLKKSLGVKDLASMYDSLSMYTSIGITDITCFLVRIVGCSMFIRTHRRLSLPASLLEPIPNLEYWHYLDRPDLMAA